MTEIFKATNNDQASPLAFRIYRNENIKYIESENHLWKFIESDVVISKEYFYSDTSGENYTNAKTTIEMMNGKLRSRYSGMNPIKLKDVACYNTEGNYAIPLESIIVNTTLSGLSFPSSKTTNPERSPKKIEIQNSAAQEVYKRCCQIFGFNDWTHWTNLYKIYEIIITFDKELRPESNSKQFTNTANAFKTGVTSRHQDLRMENNLVSKLMTAEEGVAFCRLLFSSFVDKYSVED